MRWRHFTAMLLLPVWIGGVSAWAADPAALKKLQSKRSCLKCDLSGAQLAKHILSRKNLSGSILK